MERTKLTKTSAVIDRILKILQGFLIAGAIVSLIFIPLTAIFGEKVIASADTLSLGSLELRLTGDPGAYLDIVHIKSSIIVMLISAIVSCAAAWFCLRVLREILAPMKEGQPFAQGISDKVRKLGWTVLIGGGIYELAQAVSNIFKARAYDIPTLFSQPAIAEVSYDFNISFWFVITALIIFFLSYIFRCGESLQQESDETL